MLIRSQDKMNIINLNNVETIKIENNNKIKEMEVKMSYIDDCNGEDIGGYFANDDYLAVLAEQIDNDRIRRLKNLKGKYIITCIGSKSKKKCYLQDRNISKKCWWTYYIENTIGYYSKLEAEKKAKSLRYNNCKVEFLR